VEKDREKKKRGSTWLGWLLGNKKWSWSAIFCGLDCCPVLQTIVGTQHIKT